MVPPTVIAFDLDGTLIDSRGDIVAAVNHALEATGRGALPGQVIVRYVGDGARALCARAAKLPESSEDVDELLRHFLAYYQEHPLDFTRWMPGAQETLEKLSDIADLSLCICTNKPRATTTMVLAALGVRSRFRAIVAGGDTAENKPSPAPLLHLAQVLDITPGRIVMVGDGPQDIECARRAGVRSIGVLGGFASEQVLLDARPDVLLRSLHDVPDVLRRWRDATIRISAVR
ncbi:phosphoglycolate phosphatase [Sorangium cellulosum]|uniref:phosphoglycolate phosphatase n=1 Tax=Sorangium cellulosum TaxID=56 RepID=A0A2L0FB39_SORCE|nr:HAD-IA family hydrolase [Sorangium cellulosum]AUX48774.1 phosphoglycolate phosphatase [Sorangium cellulosum]